jgi:hypothetical protein
MTMSEADDAIPPEDRRLRLTQHCKGDNIFPPGRIPVRKGDLDVRRFVPPVVGFTKDRSFCEEAAAFFNESIIRDRKIPETGRQSFDWEIVSRTEDIHHNATGE